MAGQNFEKNCNLPGKQCMGKASFSNMLLLLHWLCSDLDVLYFDSGLEFGLELFVFGSCCNSQLIV